MKTKLYLILAICLTFVASSCTTLNGSTNESDEVVFEDSDFERADPGDGDELTLYDSDFAEVSSDPAVKSEKREGKATEGNDASILQTSIDGAGNKVETREFSKNSLIKKVIVRTAVDGGVTIFVYAQNGKVKRLPKDEYQRVLRAPGNDIASAAKIYESREERDRKQEELTRRRNERIRAEKERIKAESVQPSQNRPLETEVVPVPEPESEPETQDEAPGEDRLN